MMQSRPAWYARPSRARSSQQIVALGEREANLDLPEALSAGVANYGASLGSPIPTTSRGKAEFRANYCGNGKSALRRSALTRRRLLKGHVALSSVLGVDPHFRNGAATFMRMPIVGMFHTID